MSNLLSAQEALTKDLAKVNANEVPKLLNVINEIRLTFSLKSHTLLLLYLASVLQDASENGVQYEHSDMSSLFAHEEEFVKLLE